MELVSRHGDASSSDRRDEVTDSRARRLLAVEPLCECSNSGAAAVEVVRDQAPDLILVDLELPLINGPSFVERYRRAVTTAVNIVVVSGRDDAQEIAQSIGADAYLAKPFERDDLLTAVEWSLTAR